MHRGPEIMKNKTFFIILLFIVFPFTIQIILQFKSEPSFDIYGENKEQNNTRKDLTVINKEIRENKLKTSNPTWWGWNYDDENSEAHRDVYTDGINDYRKLFLCFVVD